MPDAKPDRVAFGRQRLIAQARRLYAKEDLGLEMSSTVYALNSTAIDLCLSLFPWAPFRPAKTGAFFVTRAKSNTDLRRV